MISPGVCTSLWQAELQYLRGCIRTHMSSNSLHHNGWQGKGGDEEIPASRGSLGHLGSAVAGSVCWIHTHSGHSAWGHVWSTPRYVPTPGLGDRLHWGHSSNPPHLATAQFIKTQQLNQPRDKTMGILQHCLILCPELLFPYWNSQGNHREKNNQPYKQIMSSITTDRLHP